MLPTRIALLLCCLVAAQVPSAQAQGGPPMLTDDPGTPGDGNWEINIAALSSRSGHVTGEQLPLVDLNYGVGDRLQLKYEVPWVIEREPGTSGSALGNSLLGVKWRFFDEGEAGWLLSTYPQLEFHYGNGGSRALAIADSGTSVLLPLEFERGWDDFDLTFELGRWLRPAPRADSWIAGVVLGHEVRKGLELLAEFHDEGSTDLARNQAIVNLGLRWDATPRYTLLLSAGRDVHDSLAETQTFLAYVGLQLHL